MTERRTVVKVTIGGEEYTLKSDRPPDYTQAVADHVDQTLKELHGGGGMVESHKAAILAALAVTDELFQARAAEREMSDQLQALAAELGRVLPPGKRVGRGPGSIAGRGDEA